VAQRNGKLPDERGELRLQCRPFDEERLLRAAAAEAELQVRRGYEQALRVITDNLPALVSYVDKEERYRFHNRTYETWLHLDGERINGRTVREVWGEERYAMIAPNVARALRGERVSDEYAIVVEGVERRIMATYVPDLDIAGRVRGFFVMGIDITPNDQYILEFLEYRPKRSDPRLVQQWDTLVAQPAREAVRHIHPILQKHERLGEVFQYHRSLPELAAVSAKR